LVSVSILDSTTAAVVYSPTVVSSAVVSAAVVSETVVLASVSGVPEDESSLEHADAMSTLNTKSMTSKSEVTLRGID